MTRPNLISGIFNELEAPTAYLLAIGSGRPSSSNTTDYSYAVEAMNRLKDKGRPNFKQEDFRVFARHCYENDLHLQDFLSKEYQKYFREAEAVS